MAYKSKIIAIKFRTLLVVSGSAFASTSRLKTAACPPRAAWNNAVCPSVSIASTSNSGNVLNK